MPRSCWCPEYCTRYLGTRRLCGGAGLDSGTDNVTVLDVLIGSRGSDRGEDRENAQEESEHGIQPNEGAAQVA